MNMYTSTDGLTWNFLGELGIAQTAYNGSLFVGLGDSGIFISSNGTQWNNVNATSIGVRSVAYGNGLFVAVGDIGKIITSSDGTNWFQRISGTTENLEDVSYGNGQFVVTPYGGQALLTSQDGVHWAQRPITTIFNYSSIVSAAAANGLFVAVGGGGEIVSSTDLTNWTSRTAGVQTFKTTGLAYGNGRYVGVGPDDHFVLMSPDGLNWTSSPLPSDPPYSYYLSHVIFAGGVFVGMGAGILTSPDGVTWTPSVTPDQMPGGNATAIAYANGMFVATVGNAFGTSPDSVHWTWETFGPQGFGFTGVSFAKGQFVAAGGTSILISTDGTNWDRLDNATASPIVGVAYGNNQFVVCDAGGNVLASPDGVTWPLPNGPVLPFAPTGLSFGDGQFVSWAFSGGLLFTSSDPVNWTRRNSSMDGNLYAVPYANGSFWALGSLGAILECRTRPVLEGMQRLQSGPAKFTVVGVTGKTNIVQASSNLTDWISLTNVVSNIVLSNGIGQFTDPVATNFSTRFYRSVAY